MSTAQASTSSHVIHILSGPHYGEPTEAARTLCGTPPGPPRTWASGHLYVRIPTGLGCPAVVNCPACIQAFQGRFR